MKIPFSPQRQFDVEPMPAWGEDSNTNRVWFRCKCGSITYLDEWLISESGKVTPSVDHTESNVCDFHEYIELKDYQK